jgi:uncharacterized protein
MHILLTGGTGFIGSALCDSLSDDGCQLTILSRQQQPADSRARFVSNLDQVDASTSIDAVINLAGASLADRRWSQPYKQELLSSRLDTTRAVVELIRRLDNPPAVLLSASAIGYYGHHQDERLAEDATSTGGFAAMLCQRWESEAMALGDAGVRICLLRLGVVLDRHGGAMEQMARPFQFGVANWLGGGDQWLSWIHRQDVVAAIRFLLEHEELSGPVNLTAPEAVTSRGFCSAMKGRKRTFITMGVPAPVLKLAVGEMAEELLLNGQRVEPAALSGAGFQFSYPDLDSALETIF